MPESWQTRLRKCIRPLGYGLLALLMVWGIWPYTLFTMQPDAGQMQPQFQPGASVLVNTAYRTPGKLHRGDCIIYEIRFKGRLLRMMSRVVGFPGERVAVTEGRLIVDGQALPEPYLGTALVGEARSSRGSTDVPRRGLYVLNDNRGSPVLDSRDFGPLREEQVVGKVIMPVGAP